MLRSELLLRRVAKDVEIVNFIHFEHLRPLESVSNHPSFMMLKAGLVFPWPKLFTAWLYIQSDIFTYSNIFKAIKSTLF